MHCIISIILALANFGSFASVADPEIFLGMGIWIQLFNKSGFLSES
jgi:hypothetical protein